MLVIIRCFFFTEGSKSSKEKITNGDNEIMENGEDGQVGENDSIEDQLGDLPDFVSDDEKPIIKQEPNVSTGSDLTIVTYHQMMVVFVNVKNVNKRCQV